MSEQDGLDHGLRIHRRFHPNQYAAEIAKVPPEYREECAEYLRWIYKRWQVKSRAKNVTRGT
jgi:hypothetical protein